ncbi:MAG: ABC transporter permease [Thermoplasmata archaeon]
MNPRIVFANIVINVKGFIRAKEALFFTLLFPILLVLLFGAIFQNADDVHFDLVVQDQDKTNTSAKLVKALELNGTFTITKINASKDAVEYAKENKVNLILIIPKGYEETMFKRMVLNDLNASINMTYIYDPSSSSASTKMQILNSVFMQMNQNFSGTPPVIYTTTKSVLVKKYEYIDFFVPGIIAMASMSTSLFGTVSINAELRQKGIIRKLATTPITRAEWILSNIIYQIFLAFISTALILIVSYAVFSVNLTINLWLGIFVILNVFAFAGLGMLLTRFAKEAESASAAANALMFPMMFLAGTFFPLETMPEFLAAIAKVLPLYYVNEGLRNSMFFLDYTTAAFDALVIGIFAVVVFVLGLFTTNWKSDE